MTIWHSWPRFSKIIYLERSLLFYELTEVVKSGILLFLIVCVHIQIFTKQLVQYVFRRDILIVHFGQYFFVSFSTQITPYFDICKYILFLLRRCGLL